MALGCGALLAGAPTPALAVGGADISKTLDGTQGTGFTAPNRFTIGSLVRYNLRISCSSLQTSCGTGTVSDRLDPNLDFVRVIPPTGADVPPISTQANGQDVTVTVGPDFAAGTTLELVLVARVTSAPADGTIPNQATISVTDGPAKQSEVVQIAVPKPAPDWTLSKTQVSPPGVAALGAPVTYDIDLTAARYGNVDIAAGTTVVDTYPAGATVVDSDGGVVDTASHTITWQVDSPVTVASMDCSGTSCSTTHWRTVTLTYGAPTFAEGDTVTNRAAAEVSYADGSSGQLSASRQTKLDAGTRVIQLSKTGPARVVAGQPVTWHLETVNDGSTTLRDVAVVDRLPAGLTNVRFERADYTEPVYPASRGPVTFEALVDGGWHLVGTWNTSGELEGTFDVPPGATALRLGDASVAPGERLAIQVTATTPSDGAVGDTLTNCASVDTTTAGTTLPADQCVKSSVVAPFVQLDPFKAHAFADPAATSAAPGEEFAWGVGVKVTGAAPVTEINVADLLPPQFEYLSTDCFGAAGDGGGIQASFDDARAHCGSPAPQPGVDVRADATHLSWKALPVTVTNTTPGGYGSIFWLVLKVRVKPQTAVSNYTNVAFADTDQAETTCGRDAVTDADDLDGDHDTAETVCRATDDVQVRLAAVADVTKWDRGTMPNVAEATGVPDASCPDWEGFTRYPCVAQTVPGGDLDYRFRIKNIGNMDMTDFVAYDILPHAGDTGVSQTLAGQLRGTDWVPVLTGPVRVESEPGAADTVIEYNLTTNPCRREVASGPSDADWQVGCDSTWLTSAQVSDWSQVRSFRIKAFQKSGSSAPHWNAGEEIILSAPLVAPKDAPVSIKSPLDLSIAWNSIAHRELRVNGDGSTVRLLAAEPRKVGVIVPFPGVSVGDRVWLDVNHDGLQTEGEPPVGGVKVTLRDQAGNVVATTTTDDNGYYAFRFLNPSTPYTITFTPPEGSMLTTANAGGDTSNDLRGDLNDSDADQATGSVSFTTPATGTNLGDPAAGQAGQADNPGLDAGLLTAINLRLKKAVTSSGSYLPGSPVTFTLTPSNDGPIDAWKGWRVTELMPAALDLVSISGQGYSCDTGDPAAPVCTAGFNLPAGTDAAPITVVATVRAGTSGAVRNVAYVAPSTDEGVAEPAETVPLDAPTRSTDTDASATDNDAQASVTVTSPVSVGDFVWWDNDRDGRQDDNEPPVAGLTVNLYDAHGTLVATTTTDSDGFYFFADLLPGTEYQVGFVKPDGAGFTRPGVGDDKHDSNPDPATGRTTLTTPESGENLKEPGHTDDPTIDAGLVRVNLTLAKTLDTPGAIYTGDTITFTLRPHNGGPSAALAGWSVTELFPEGLELVSMSGDGYQCAGLTCVADSALGGGQDGPAITVVAKVVSAGVGERTNIAWVSPVPGDTTESNPLVIPENGTDTGVTPTDNDAQAPFEVKEPVTAPTEDHLAFTGAEGIPAMVGLALVLVAAGLVLRRRARQRW
jgi:fimbrial isopeptide formation D2 family protein/uncharacterized repeat protein (TIGR01451 family)